MTIDHKLMRWFAKHQGEAAKEADIRRELGISHGTFHQARARLLAAGLLKRHKEGALYVYDLPDEAAAAFGSAAAETTLPKGSGAGAAAPPSVPPVPRARARAESSSEEQELPDLSGHYANLEEVQDAILALEQDVSFSFDNGDLVVESSDGLHMDTYSVDLRWDGAELELLSRG